MVDYSIYNLTSDDIDFLEDLRDHIVVGQCDTGLEYIRGDFQYSFLVEPMGGPIYVWRFDEIIAQHSSFDDFLVNFLIDGKPFIACIPDIYYSQD